MKRILQLLTLSFFLFTLSCEKEEELIDINAEKQLPKVEVCHYDAFTDTWTTISISENALKAHLAHGDFEGSCENRKTYVPDDSFERFLIFKGYDDILDDYVLTSKIENITELEIPYDNPGGCGEDWYCEIVDITGIEDFISLRDLYIGGGLVNKIIDFSFAPNLEKLTLDEVFSITNIDLAKNFALKQLHIAKAPEITTLDLTNNTALLSLYLERVFLTTLDMSNNTKLNYLTIYDPDLKSLNIKNGNNRNLFFDVTVVPNLTCIQVDDVLWSTENWTNELIYSDDCY